MASLGESLKGVSTPEDSPQMGLEIVLLVMHFQSADGGPPRRVTAKVTVVEVIRAGIDTTIVEAPPGAR